MNSDMFPAVKYLLLLAAGFVVMKMYLSIADKYNIVDKPNNRSSHSKVTVRGGGIIIPLFALTWFFLYGLQYPFFFAGLIIISLVSFLDDIFQLSSKLRLLLQTISVLLLFFQLNFASYPVWIWVLIGIISLGIINAYNFMDGINGITAGYSAAVLTGLWLVNNFQVRFIQNELIYYTGMAIAIFAFFNFRKKAVCFAGDIGSVSISFIILFLLLLLILKSGNPAYLLFLSVYGADSTLTIFYRLKHKENIFKPHRKHIYQLCVNELGYSHLFISFIYSFVQLLICFIVYSIINSEISIVWITSLGLIGLHILLFVIARIRINKKLLA